eukprot:CAMPEP_0174913546 /NCGR_PEP_ID=MMETSP0167-20121228/80377_1 /TAXON_ID=38298 /ORGANISM="Rhodella maculata, Strain CCMP736" /LENGTH=113 /DNA_ID=CAMNT_0016158271 /DNA_START=441 /DNA_END=782 /DNA_ORIENTATION=+
MAQCFCSLCDEYKALGTAGSYATEDEKCCLSEDAAEAMGDLGECETMKKWFLEILDKAGAKGGAPAKQRKEAYREYVARKHGTLGYGVRVDIPTCISAGGHFDLYKGSYSKGL